MTRRAKFSHPSCTHKKEKKTKKKQKGSPFIGDDKESEVLPPQLHP
jgi:hypothetical protein